jgi:hypothetical protein
MKSAIFMIGTAALALASAPAAAAERSFPVAGFDRLAIGGPLEVEVRVGNTSSVRATGSTEDLDRLEVTSEKGQLTIRPKDRSRGWGGMGPRGPVRIAITTTALREVNLAGSGSVRVDHAHAPALGATVAGSGSIRIGMIDSRRITARVAGSGSIEGGGGRCSALEADIAGSGEIRLGSLPCTTLGAKIAGSGAIEAKASQSATIRIVGSGTARVTGGAECKVSKVGSGSARCS